MKSFKRKALMGTAAAGAVCLVTGVCMYHMALNAGTDKSILLKSRPRQARSDEEILQKHKLALEESERLTGQYKDACIQSSDRLKLHGYLCRQKEGADTGGQWAVLVHGYNDSGLWFREEALSFYKQGFHLLLPDSRGHGKSQGAYVGMGWHDRLDIVSWIHWITDQDPDAKIVLYGVSMGAATVMMAAGEALPSNVKAIVEDCGYTSAWDILKYQLKAQFHLPAYPVLACASLITRLRAGYGLKEANAINCVSKTKIPILFIHGTEDSFVPFEMSKRLYEACKSDKEYLAVEGAVHVKSALVGGLTYWNKVFRFLDRYL